MVSYFGVLFYIVCKRQRKNISTEENKFFLYKIIFSITRRTRDFLHLNARELLVLVMVF